MAEIGVHEAKTTFSQLLRRVAAGEEIVIVRNGDPVAKLVPVDAEGRRPLGLDDGRIRIADDFDAPAPDQVLESFET